MSGTPFHLEPTTGRYFFEKIAQSEVDTQTIARAEDVRAFVCPDLKIEPPQIVWIRPAPTALKRVPLKKDYEEELDLVVRLGHDVPGGATPYNYSLREIWIRRDLTAFPDVEYAVAHELRHAAQKKHCPEVFNDRPRAEGDAYPYGYAVLKRYFASANRPTDNLRQGIDRQGAETRKWFQTCYPSGEYKTIRCFPRG